MKYLLDSNTLVEAKNHYYRFSFCSGYWDWILKKNDDDILFLVDKIKTELLKGNDDLTNWIKTSPAKLCIKPHTQLPVSLGLIAKWVNSQKFTEQAKTIFYNSADYYLIAYAHALSYTVVTREQSHPNSVNRVMIPDVCGAMNVKVISPFELLELEGAQFVCANT